MKFLYHLGQYITFIRKAFCKPEKMKVYSKEMILEFEKLGLNSIIAGRHYFLFYRSSVDFTNGL